MIRKIGNFIYKHRELILEIAIILLIILFSISVAQKTLQNDTFYTISIGKLIEKNGIDMMDHFSWHEGLSYTYPHWLYDLSIYKIYSIGGFDAIYISTCVLSAILGIAIYKVNSKLNKEKIISLFITIGSMYLLKGYIAARAQLVTFILFILNLYNIEKFIETKHKRNAFALILISILIANLHVAAWPFTIVLYLPYIAEYFIAVIADVVIYKKISLRILKDRLKKHPEDEKRIQELNEYVEKVKIKREENKKNPYKINIKRNNNVALLLIILVVVVLAGLLTPLGNTPYTYTFLTLKGNTMQNISEHLPLTLINNAPIMCTLIIFIATLTFTNVKIRLSDLFMLGGTVYLMFSTRRQASMFVLICSVILTRILIQLVATYKSIIINKKIEEILIKYATLLIFFICIVVLSVNYINEKKNYKYISNSKYPVEATEWILNNLDVKNIKLYNEYNYGSYLIFKEIPVFIDSRADLYAPEFNKGKDIFSDFIGTSNISKYYGTTFEKYGITHVLITKGSKTAMLIKKANPEKFEELYSDNDFVIYKIINY